MSPCKPDQHRLTFINEEQGETTWRCEDCNETIINYQDTHGG